MAGWSRLTSDFNSYHLTHTWREKEALNNLTLMKTMNPCLFFFLSFLNPTTGTDRISASVFLLHLKPVASVSVFKDESFLCSTSFCRRSQRPWSQAASLCCASGLNELKVIADVCHWTFSQRRCRKQARAGCVFIAKSHPLLHRTNYCCTVCAFAVLVGQRDR